MNTRIRKLTRAATRLLAVAGLFSTAAATAAGETRQAGPFEITTHVQRVSEPGAFMRTGNPFRTEKVREYTVRWKGQPVEVPIVGRRFWQALQLPQAQRPALILVNGPHLHLVIDAGERLDTRALAPDPGSAELQWLDAASGQPAAPVAQLGLDPVAMPATTNLNAGRWLYVNRRLVLDTQTLSTVTVEPWLRTGQGEKVVEINASTTNAVALSPGRTRFVLPAEGQDYTRNGERFDALMLIDMATGKPEALRLDRARTPYGHLLEIDAAWMAARWQWVREAGGRERLVAR